MALEDLKYKSDYIAADRARIVEDHDQIKDLLKECRVKYDVNYQKYLTQAKINEKLSNGDQFSGPGTTDRYLSLFPDAPHKLPHNSQGNIVLTWSSLITKDRPGAYAVPVGSQLEDKISAEITTKLIEYLESELQTAELIHKSALYAANHGTAGLMAVYNPSTELVEWRVLSIFDFMVDSTPDMQWIITREMIDVWSAKQLLESTQSLEEGEVADDVWPKTERFDDGLGQGREGVAKYTIWYKPCYRYPTGLYACIVNDTVVEAMEYPYVFASKDGKPEAILPVVLWKAKELRNSTLGITWCSDTSPLQVALNELNARIHKRAVQSQQYLLLPKAIARDGLDEDNLIISYDDSMTGQVERIDWISPAPIDQQLYGQREYLIKTIYDTAGISESTAGNAAASQSGRAMSYQSSLDSQKHAGAAKSLETAILNIWKLTIKLVQKYYTTERKVMLADNAQEFVFTGSDIAGVDVRLEPRSERDSYASTKEEKARADLAGGLIDTNTYNTRSGSIDSYLGKEHANHIIDALLAGQDVALTPETIAPEILLGAIQDRLEEAYLNKDMDTVTVLSNLQAEYVKMLNASKSGEAATPAAPATTPPPNTQPLPESPEQEIGVQ